MLILIQNMSKLQLYNANEKFFSLKSYNFHISLLILLYNNVNVNLATLRLYTI
jgi:hypothetical protein